MRTWLVLLLAAGSGSVAKGAPQADDTKALDMPKHLSTAPFRDVDLDRRCEALVQFLDTFSNRHLSGAAVRGIGCSEGRGLYDLRYKLDFNLSPNAESSTFGLTLDAEWSASGSVTVKLCSGEAPSPPCYADGSASGVLGAAVAKQPNLARIIPTLSAWLAAPGQRHSVFGTEYRVFVSSVVAWKRGFPGTASQAGAIPLQLVPDSSGQPEHGSIKVSGTLSDDFLRCIGCPDKTCIETEVRYQFDERFLRLRRGANSDVEAGGGPGDVAWVIESPTPLSEDPKRRDWTFLCGAARYSLYNTSAKN